MAQLASDGDAAMLPPPAASLDWGSGSPGAGYEGAGPDNHPQSQGGMRPLGMGSGPRGWGGGGMPQTAQSPASLRFPTLGGSGFPLPVGRVGPVPLGPGPGGSGPVG